MEMNSILEAFQPISMALFIIPLLFLFLLTRLRRQLPYPPGPKGLPLIGNMMMMDQLTHRGLAKLAKKYGGLFHLRMGYLHMVAVSSPEIARQVLQVQDNIFSNRPATIAISYLTYDRADMAFAHYGPFWRQMRKLCVMKLFSRKRAESWESVRDEVDYMVRSVVTSAGSAVNIGEMVFALTRNITYRAAFGSSSHEGQDDFIKILQEFSKLFGAFNIADFIPSLSWVDPQGLGDRLAKARASLDGFIDSIIDDHMQKYKTSKCADDEGTTDMVDDLLAFYSDEAKVTESDDLQNAIKLTRDNIKAIIMDVMFGGTETVASAIEWAMSELMKSPEDLKRVQQELADVVGLHRRVEESDFEKLTFLNAVLVTPQQAEKLSRRREVANVVLDFTVRTATTHTPQFLGLPQGAWAQEGGYELAGEGVVIGFIDTGIDPTHPSFSDDLSESPYPVPEHFSGICEVTRDFPSGSCNRKLIGARHFAASAITRGIFNASQDYASPFDGDGHGTHTASIAAGNHGIPVVVAGHHFGNASGMAPRSHIAVYKALYKSFGGFAADVVAAIDQAAQDGVDIISLSITPNRRPPGIATFFNPIDMALLSAVKAGIFVVQAAGNTGPSPKSIFSFSPWIFTVGAATHDRIYSNSIVLGNNVTIPGVGLASGTDNDTMYTMVSALHALNDNTTAENDMYVGECQDDSNLNQDVVQGNLLICSYSIRFVLGLSTIKQALQTAKNLSAVGVVFYMDPFVIGFQLNPVPLRLPGIIIQSPDDSKILLQYYNSSLKRDGLTKKIVKFGAVASISGGLKANYSYSAPKIMYYSARGPDPEDSFLDDADILKPNLVAPGNSIWAAWSSLGTDSVEFQGEDFAMMSGTSMAAPHVAGLAALIKQKFPTFSPSAIGSALSTTASLYDKNGGPIMAQRAYTNPDLNQSPATPFDMGSGFVDATAALDPGLIFYSSYDEYMSFLCGINGSAPVVMNYTGQNCGVSTMSGADLNLPSITIAKLNQSRVVQRTVTNIASNETYSVGWSAPYGVSVSVDPIRFSIVTGERLVLSVYLNATINSAVTSYGRIGLFGHQGHIVNIPLSVIVKFSYNTTTS